MDTWEHEIDAAAFAIETDDLDRARPRVEAAWFASRGRMQQARTFSMLARLGEATEQYDRAASAWFLASALGSGFLEQDVVTAYTRPLHHLQRALNYDAVLLAGGAGRRFGTPDKPLAQLCGWPLIDHVLLATAGATERIVVGPRHRRSRLGQPLVCQEEPAGSGPVSALAAGAALIRRPTAAVLASDLPLIGQALPALRAALLADESASPPDAAVLVDTEGRLNYLAAIWRTSSLLRALDSIGDPANASMRSLYDKNRVVAVADFDASGRDCDTVADLQYVADRITPRRGQPLPPTLLAWPRLELFPPS